MSGMPARHRDRGVSDVVAFVLTFSIIIVGVGVASTGTFDTLVEVSENQHIQNSERGLESAAAALDNLDQNADTYRRFDVGVAGGSVIYSQTEVTINVSGSGISGATEDDINRTVSINAIEKRFENRGINLAFEGGGVFRDPSARARYEPTVQCSGGNRIGDDVAIISLLALNLTNDFNEVPDSTQSEVSVSPTSVLEEAPPGASNEVVPFAANVASYDRAVATGVDANVTIDISDTAYPDQWDNYLDRPSSNWIFDSNGQYTCDLSDGTVLVRITTVNLFNADI